MMWNAILRNHLKCYVSARYVMSYLIAMLVRAVLSLIVILGRVVLNKFMAVRMTRYRWSNVSKKLLVSSRKMFRNQIQLKKKKNLCIDGNQEIVSSFV